MHFSGLGWRSMGKGKSPEVPFHGITLPYSYFEVIWIFAPFQQETWSRKIISWREIKSLLTKPSNVLPFYTSSQNSNFCTVKLISWKVVNLSHLYWCIKLPGLSKQKNLLTSFMDGPLSISFGLANHAKPC